MSWTPILQILYTIALVVVILHIIYSIKDNSKALAFILLVAFLPIIGFFLYFMFGFNFHKIRAFAKKRKGDQQLKEKLLLNRNMHEAQFVEQMSAQSKKIASLVYNEDAAPLTSDNKVEFLLNGENKFPSLLDTISQAKDHIHMIYYIYRDDDTGKSIEKVLIEKAMEGVEVRLIYDDLGSLSIGKGMVPRLREAGVHVYPFEEIKFMLMANRYNYRNHRKIVIVDGHTAFVGGINVGNEYVNESTFKNGQFWRDSHLKMSGSAVYYLQFLFIADWNHCCSDEHLINEHSRYIAEIPSKLKGKQVVQTVASGPDSSQPSIEHSIIAAINGATKEVLITTPYFVPSAPVLEAIIISSFSGVKVKLLVPDKGDSKLVDAASEFYYDRILEAGVEIYLYTKGFIHAKTIVIDERLAILGTANIDIRSFDLNFEVNSIIYEEELASKMKEVFIADLKDSEKVNPERWANRSKVLQMKQNIARLLSPIL